MKPTKQEQPSVREHWSAAPAHIRNNLQHFQSEAARHGGRHVLAFIRACVSAGYDCERSEIEAVSIISREISAAGSPQAKARVVQDRGSLESACEGQALKIWDSMIGSKWRATSNAQAQAERKAKGDAQRRTATVNARAAEILAENQRAAERAALAQAEQEVA